MSGLPDHADERCGWTTSWPHADTGKRFGQGVGTQPESASVPRHTSRSYPLQIDLKLIFSSQTQQQSPLIDLTLKSLPCNLLICLVR